MNFIRKIVASLSVLALAAVLMPNAKAADLVATVIAPTDGVPGAATTIQFSFATTLTVGDEVVITIPASFAGFAALTATDVVLASSGGAATFTGVEVFDTVKQTITSTVDGASTGSETYNVTIGGANQLSLPTTSGQTTISFFTTDGAGTVENSGYALIPHDNTVVITAHVAEALVMTIDDTTILLDVDPSVNEGRDYTEKNVLTVQTNAYSGYVIQGKLEDGSGAAALQEPTTKEAIAAGDAIGTDNRFGYMAYNAEETKTQAELLAYGTSTAYLTTSSANLVLSGSDPTTVNYNGVTNEQKHTVYYALNVDYLTPAGDYEGTITYTVLPSF